MGEGIRTAGGRWTKGELRRADILAQPLVTRAYETRGTIATDGSASREGLGKLPKRKYGVEISCSPAADASHRGKADLKLLHGDFRNSTEFRPAFPPIYHTHSP